MQALPPVFFELELYTLKNQSEEKLYPVQVNKEASVPVLPAGSAKVFNVPMYRSVSFLSGSVSL